MLRVLEERPWPDAVCCFNDSVAIGAMKAMCEKAIAVPHDMAVVGYDDIAIAAYCVPSLTTVHQPTLQMCREGVGLLLDILDGKVPHDYYRRTVFEPELVIRETSGGNIGRSTG